jgi:ribosome-associated protein
MDINHIDLSPEYTFKTSRSSGKGGQNVNKVSTKVELGFDVPNSSLLDPDQKHKIMQRAANRITKDGILQIVVQSERSQFRNKELAIEKFKEVIAACFVEKKKRIRSRTPRSIKEKRLKTKKHRSDIKKLRKNKEW